MSLIVKTITYLQCDGCKIATQPIEDSNVDNNGARHDYDVLIQALNKGWVHMSTNIELSDGVHHLCQRCANLARYAVRMPR